VGATGYGQLINYIKCIGFPENKPLLTLIPGADTSKIQMPMQGDPNLNAPTSDDVMKKIAELFEIAKTNSRDIDNFAQDGVENSIHISSAKNRIQNLDQKMDKYDSITFAYMVISVVSAVVTVGVLIKFLFFM
jgi:ABC-type antimicrobial peptide transport system permease subunit